MARADLGGALLAGLADALANAGETSPAVALLGPLSAFFSQHRYAAILVEGRTVTVNRQFHRAPGLEQPLASLHAALTDRGVGGLLLGGTWRSGAVEALAAAFAAAPTGPRTAVAKELGAITGEAVVQVLGPGDARFWPPDPGAVQLTDRELATFCHSRLVALADCTLRHTHQGRSPDLFSDSVRRALTEVADGIDREPFKRRLLSMPLLPSKGQSSHAANVACLTLAMGHLLGLDRRLLIDLGFAAFFHDAGRGSAPRAAATEGGEERGAAEKHVLEGTRACLRGGQGRAAELRLMVVGEHHVRADGYPSPAPTPHAITDLISVADAFDRLEHGSPWRSPLSPAAAIRELASHPARYDPEAVALLRDVLGAFPRGSFVRTQQGAVLLVVDGGAWRDHKPIGRALMLSDGSAADRSLVALEEFEEDDIDPTILGFKPWKIALGKGELELEPGEWPEDAGDEPSPAELDMLIMLLDKLLDAVSVFTSYPPDHREARAAVEVLREALAQPLEQYPKLSLEFNVHGVCSRGAVVRPTEECGPLLDALRPQRISSLTLRRGLDATGLRDLVTTLSALSLGLELDVASAFWAANVPNASLEALDAHCPSAVESESEVLEAEVNGLILELYGQAPAGSDELDAFCAALAAAGDLKSLGPHAARRAEFLSTPAGSSRTLLFERLTAPAHLHAVQVARRAKRDCSPDDIAAFHTGLVHRLLWEATLDDALDVLETIAGEGDLPASLAKELSSELSLRLLVRRLRSQSQDPDVGGGVAFLNLVGPRATPGVCALYAELEGEEPLRRLLATYLVPHVRIDPAPLVPLSLNEDTQIAREALILMGVGGPGSPGSGLLERFASDKDDEDPRVTVRVKIAREILAESTGADTLRELLETARTATTKTDRVAAIVQLRKVGNQQAFDELVKLARTREFSSRDDDEIEAVLQTLGEIGGGRAVKVLEELSRSSFLGIATGTRRIARAATGRLSSLRKEIQQEKTQRIYLKGVCARCKFENMPGAKRCLQCGGPLGEERKPAVKDDTGRLKHPTVKLKRPAGEPGPQEPTVQRGASGRMTRAQADAEALASARQAAGKTEALAWLSYPLLPPVPLGTKAVVTIGRSHGADLELVHESVSRSHAVIRVAGNQLILEDRSSYGTWLNGKRVMNAEIKPGDVITVGPYDIAIEPGLVGANRETDTRPMRTFASSEAIGGRLERVSLAEVLQQIEFNEKTGTLEVFTEENERAVLVIYEGKPMYAEFAGARDAAAVVKMLSLNKGNFSFLNKIEAGEMTMSGATLTGLLMEASRQIDEAAMGGGG